MSSANGAGVDTLPPVSRTRTIAADVGDVWTAIATPGSLEHAHPFCARNPVTRWPGPESCDEVHYLSGWIYHREFTDWADGAGYDLRIGSAGERPSLVSWRIAERGSASTNLTIKIRPRPLDRIPRLARRATHLGYVRPLLRRYLESVLRGHDWWITTGDPVTRNQFGRHPWFSDKR